MSATWMRSNLVVVGEAVHQLSQRSAELLRFYAREGLLRVAGDRIDVVRLETGDLHLGGMVTPLAGNPTDACAVVGRLGLDFHCEGLQSARITPEL